MTDRLGRDAERVSCPGEYRLHVRRLVALFAGLGVLEIGILSGPTVYFTEGVNPIAALLLAPIVALAVVIAGVAAGAIYLRRSGRPRRDLLRRADRLLAGLLAALLGVYVAVACVLAATRLLPIAAPGDALARMHPMLGWYFVIAAAGAVVLTRRWRFIFVVALAPLLLMVNATAIGELQFVSVEDVMLDMATNLATIGALTWLLRLAETSDASGARQRAQAVELAAHQASTRAQHEANSFIHDHILSALIAVANGLPDRAALRGSARQALDSLRTETAVASPVAARTLLNDVAGRVGAMAGDIRINVVLAREHEISPEVAQAITEATLEAVRNSLRHAGNKDTPVMRTVTLTSDAWGISIEVSDNGCGFDPAVAGRGRHGVSGSIIARMQDVGGRATVDSAPGEGACVTLRWRPNLDSADQQRPERDVAQSEAASWERSLSASMESAGARAIAAGLALVHFILLVYECAVHSYWHWPPAALSFIALLPPAVLLLKAWPDALLPRWVAQLTVVVIGAVNFLVLPQIITTGWPGYASWCTGAGSDLSRGLLMRGRPVYAWVGSAATTLATAYWVISTGRPLFMIFTYMLGHYFTLASWHGVAHLSTRATTQIAATQRETARLQAQQRAHEEADRIMTSRMASVRQRVTPLLTQIADGKAPTPKLRSQAYLLEAELRDEIRAPFFTGTSIVTSAQDARRRGTEVILLDDSGDTTTIDDRTRANAVNYVTKLLDLTQSNRVVIRLNPPRRPTLLTIVTDDTRYRLDRQGELIAESAGGQVN